MNVPVGDIRGSTFKIFKVCKLYTLSKINVFCYISTDFWIFCILLYIKIDHIPLKDALDAFTLLKVMPIKNKAMRQEF